MLAFSTSNYEASIDDLQSTLKLGTYDNKCEVLCVNTVSTLMRVLNRQDASNKIMVMSEYIVSA